MSRATRGQTAQTALIRENAAQTPFREHSEALFLTSSFTFANAEEAAKHFAKSGEGYIYSRFSNPTADTFCRRLAALEGAPFALATGSGMAAILAALVGACRAGDTVAASMHLFGATVQLLDIFAKRFAVKVVYIARPEEWARVRRAALFLAETPSNPLIEIADIGALAKAAHKAGARLAIDNCFCPATQRPLALGADLVIHSATKYPDGQGRVLGGAILGERDFLMENIYPFLRAAGPALSPFNAWVLLKGLETLPLRMKAHGEAALAIARWLEGRKKIRRVLYSGLDSHPARDLAMRQQNGNGGGIISLALAGGRAAAFRFINALRIFSITANFGDAKSTVTHPATTTHSRIPAAMRKKIGLGDNLVRLSIGLENPDDLKADLARALAAM
jgi:O-succinylhomoserine sulfhydrylase